MNRAPKPCRCRYARHRHGTPAAWQQCGCRCWPCTTAYNARCRARRAGQPLPARAVGTVPAVGARRRLEALHAIGYSDAEIGRHLGGVSFQWVYKVRREHTHVQPATLDAIAALYDQLWDKAPTGRHAAKVRRHAQKLGYVVPMAWADEDLDNPDAQPWRPSGSGSWEHRPHGTLAAARRHRRNGEPLCERCRAAENRHEDEAA